MVVFHVCRGRSEFRFTASVATGNDALIRSLCRVHNLRLRLAALADALEEMRRYRVGTLLQEQEREQEGVVDKASKEFNGVYRLDCKRSQSPDVLTRVVADVKMALDTKTHVARRVGIDEKELQEKLQSIRTAVCMAFPMGLSRDDAVQRLLDAEDGDEALTSTLDVMEEDTAELWWADKQFLRDQCIRDLTGANEKSTLLVSLHKHGGGALESIAEPRTTMASACKTLEKDLQQAAKNTTDDYTIASWVDPTALKKSLRSTTKYRSL